MFVFVLNDRIHHLANIPSFFLQDTMSAVGSVDPAMTETYRPLTLTTFSLDSAWTGRNPLGYHITNLILQLLCITLVYYTARAALAEQNRRWAWLAAALFAFSPWLGEAHIWINGRSDPLCTAFVLGAMLAWDRALRERKTAYHLLCLALFFAALLCKEVAVGALPALLLWPTLARERPRWQERLWPLLAPALAVGLYLSVRFRVLGSPQSQQDASMLFGTLGNYGLLFFDALRAVLLPAPPYMRVLSYGYDAVSPGASWLITGLALALIATVLLFRRRQPTLAWSVAFFACTLAPAVTITTSTWPGFGRYLYLPWAGLSIGLVDALMSSVQRAGFVEKPRMKQLLVVAMGAYLGLGALLLHRYVYDFESDGSLYAAVIDAEPDAAYGYGYLGMGLVNINQSEPALQYLEEALQRDPDNIKYRTGYAQALINTGQQEEALELLEGWLRAGTIGEAPMYLFRIMNAVERSDPERAVGAALACLRVNTEWRTCSRRLGELTQDPELGADYRAALEAQLGHPDNQPIVGQVLARIQ
jgi:tetratricopeptide (TPR) repeat protein